ncbi:MAG: hypothetical protein HRU41_04980 [Saprospiraceae bacterium]|nr:hypothetical protein [Saprospiraceae bacterium]
MKPRTLLFLILALCTLTSTMSLAQSRAETRAKNRANQNVDRKIDQSVDKAFNKIEGLFKRKNKKKKKKKGETETTQETTTQEKSGNTDQSEEEYQEEQAQNMVNNILKGMGGNDEPWEPYQNEYPMSFVMDMATTDKKGRVEKTNIQYVFDTWKLGMIYTLEDGETMQMILDNQEGSMTTVMDQDGEKQGFKMKQRKYNIPEAEEETDKTWEDQGVSIKKTGRTKTTEEGYFAHEYEVTSNDGNGTMWTTEDLPINFLNVMQSSFARTQQAGNKKQAHPSMNTYGVKGFPIETHFTDSKGKETVDMYIKKFKTGDQIDRSPLDTKGVKIMSMGF